MIKLKQLIISIATILVLVGAVFASGQAEAVYPSRALTIVVPWNPGGVSDIRARIIAEYLEEELGQPVVIRNTSGASGTVGTEEALQAEPDGYTLISIDDATWYGLHNGIGDYQLSDFAPISVMAKWPIAIAVRADSPWETILDLVEDARANPGTIPLAMTTGNQSHMIPVEIQNLTGAEFSFVAPQGDAARNAALLSGTVDAAMTYVAAVAEYLEAGEFRLLTHTLGSRLPNLPEVPTMQEQGIDIVYEMMGGFAAPAGTPQDRLDILESALSRVAANPELQARLSEFSIFVDFMSTAETAEYLVEVNERISRFAQLVSQ